MRCIQSLLLVLNSIKFDSPEVASSAIVPLLKECNMTLTDTVIAQLVSDWRLPNEEQPPFISEYLADIFNITIAEVFPEHTTIVTSTGRVECHDPFLKVWCFRIELVEFDIIKQLDDMIDVYGAVCTESYKANFHLKGSQSGDGMYNNFYELGYRIRHNCTTGTERVIRDYAVEMDELYPVKLDSVHLHKNIYLNNMGSIKYDWGRE